MEEKKQNFNPRIFIRQYDRYLAAGIFALILAGAYFLVLAPNWTKIRMINQRNLADVDSRLAQRRAYAGDLGELIKNYDSIAKSDLARLDQILPKEADISGLFVQLADLAAVYNLRLTGITVNEAAEITVAGQRIKSLNVSLNLLGPEGSGYFEIKNFLEGLEKNLRLFDVNAVYFNPKNPAYSLTLQTYYY